MTETIEISVRLFYTSDEADVTPTVRFLTNSEVVADKLGHCIVAMIPGLKKQMDGLSSEVLDDLRPMTLDEIEAYRADEGDK